MLSVPLPNLRTYRITSESTDVIEDAVRWFASPPAAPSADRVGVIGVSFSGGLALVAAGRPSLDGRITAVVSLGGHGNLPRVMKYLCNGQLPDGSVRPPHDYGAAIIMRSAVAELGLVPPAQRAGATDAIVTFLDASSYAESSPSRAERLLTSARAASDISTSRRARSCGTSSIATSARSARCSFHTSSNSAAIRHCRRSDRRRRARRCSCSMDAPTT